jgi:hypothetical protein
MRGSAMLLVCAVFALVLQTEAQMAAQQASGPDSKECITVDYRSKCFMQRVAFLEGLILFGVLMAATLAALTCMSALTTPTKFQQPKERTD